MKEYIAMWKNFANFKGMTTRRGYWMPFLVNFIITVLLEALIKVFPVTETVLEIYQVLALIPGLALTVRRLRDAGKHWANIFFAFIPLVGAIMVIVFLCRPSVSESAEHV